jgi:aspartate/glutamate racemase
MLALLDKLRVIEAYGIDFLWLNGNYQRALFHRVRKSSVIRLHDLAEPRCRVEWPSAQRVQLLRQSALS